MTAVHRLTREEARQIAVRSQLLDASMPTDLLDTVRRLTLVQYEPTAAVAPSADLVLWSRLGRYFRPDDLQRALASHVLLEMRSMMRPAHDAALYRAEMQAWPGEDATGWARHQADWVAANDACRRDILARLRDAGPTISRDLPDTCVEPWKSSGWNSGRNVAMMLELMELRGDVAVAGRLGRERQWDLAERLYPDDPVVPEPDASHERRMRRLRSLGVARARTTQTPGEQNDVGDVGEPAVIDGVRGQWRVDPAQLGRDFEGRTALLSPFDRLVFDRKRMLELFEFDYQLGIYTPEPKRRFGFYALPVLHGDRLVGKVDATANAPDGILRVNRIYEDEPWNAELKDAVTAELESLAFMLRLRVQRDTAG
ncbi:DNA glycosylase AlkZ-like family protein [Humibacter ginsenosidimutans]|uniref:Winged helix-turn-helix domain-containing protein n=1 Tax=Humibacter ginsenosidimutans TaxID=2599293 RepID=A0A5B8M4V7_9MICO|nr:crosslink repair DNA glycosylase YcaQ family protein [Humibacter ginsenosidimutans]QDZ15758.1 winged helix-turn-helix domain-containing protein [Humibacter ginsenosidimutans]